MKQSIKFSVALSVLFVLCNLITPKLFAQTTANGIFFQAVARDNFSNPAKDRKIYIESSIIQYTATGTKVLIEQHEANTDETGVFNISLGNGKRIGGTATNLTNIDWAMGPYFLSLKIAITPRAPIPNWDYTKEWIDLGTTPFGTVPYALYAGSAAGLNDKLSISDTVKMLTPYAKVSAVKILETGLATKLTATDTSTMLATYAKVSAVKILETGLATKLTATDTSTMLANYAKVSAVKILETGLATKLTATDTSTMLANYAKTNQTIDTAFLKSQLAKKVSLTDTATMLANYLTALNALKEAKLNASDTVWLSSRINEKANASDVNASLGLKANTSDLTSGLGTKVDKIVGKELSTNDYTTVEKTKLAAITGTNTGDQDLSAYATAANVTTSLALKANTSDVTSSLGLKANSSDVTNSLALKANLASPTFTGTVSGIDKTMIGLGNADNTSDVNKPVSTAAQTALDLKANLASPTFTGTPILPTGTTVVTQNSGDNSTKIATTAYVTTAVSAAKSIITSSQWTTATSDIYYNSGKVGVGTSSPAAKLQVVGGDRNNMIRVESDNNASVTLKNTSANAGGGEYQMFVSSSNSNSALDAGSLSIYYDHPSDAAYRFSINTAGNVGIGTGKPNEKLDVNGNMKFSGALMPNNSAGTSGQILTSAGVNTAPTWTTPSTTADAGTLTGKTLASNIVYSSLTSVGTLSAGAVPYSLLTGTVPTWNQNTTGNAATATIATNAGTATTTTGNAGTATTLATARKINNVDFDGSADITVTADAGTLSGTVSVANGGTGLTSVGSNGQVLTTSNVGTLAWTTPFTGVPYSGANQAVNLGAYDLTANGMTIGLGGGSIEYNTSIGRNGLSTNTLGSNNTAVGRNSMRFNTSGNGNTAVGFGSLQGTISNSQTGNNNTAFGQSSLNVNSTGSDNAAFGTLSLLFNQAGSYNTSLGTRSMYNNVYGNNNTAVGWNSATFTGQGGTSSSSGGNNNTSLGYRALYANTLGNDNTAIGYQALQTNSTGIQNTSIGSGANVASGALMNTTAIGSGAIVSTSNTIQLGNTFVSDVKTSGTLTAGAVTYPNTHGSANQVLSTTGSGTLVWTTASGVKGSGTINFVPKFSNTSELGNSSISEDGTGLYIGKSTGGAGVYTGLNGDNNTRLFVNGGRELESIKMSFPGDPYNNELSFNWYSSAWRMRTERSSGDITDLSFWRTAGGSTSEMMRLTSQGYLGIGNNNPSEKLDVTGNIKFSRALMPNNSAGTSGQILTSAGVNAAPTWTTPSTTAASATILATARNINGVSFDGSADITVTADAGTLTGASLKSTITGSSLTSVGTLASATVNGKVIVGASSAASASAVLEASSTTQGFLPPRMTEAQRNLINSPATGLIVYCSNCGSAGEPQYYNGTAWVNMIGTTAAAPITIGSVYGGGIVYYILQSGDNGYDANVQHGLIAPFNSISRQSTSPLPPIVESQIGKSAATISGATNVGTLLGRTNTDAIIANQGSTGTYAALYCRNYANPTSKTFNGVSYTFPVYSDWYMPSTLEIQKFRAYVWSVHPSKGSYINYGSNLIYYNGTLGNGNDYAWGKYLSSTMTGQGYHINYVETNSDTETTPYNGWGETDRLVVMPIRSF